jgi:hypothetical protein
LIGSKPFFPCRKVTTYWAKSCDFGRLKRFAERKKSLVTIRNPEDHKMFDLRNYARNHLATASKAIVEDSANPDFYLFIMFIMPALDGCL